MHFFKKPAMQQVPWNKGKLIGQKPPLQLKHVWAMDDVLCATDGAVVGEVVVEERGKVNGHWSTSNS